MKIVIVGTGYVGLVSGACFAELGSEVVCVDVDKEKIGALRKGEIPIYEPGLAEIVEKNSKAKRLTFSTSLEDSLEGAAALFIAVGTPSKEDGSADLSDVLKVAQGAGRAMKSPLLIVTKSTVPVGTHDKVRGAVSAELARRGVNMQFDVASNPEFLKEGDAVNDFLDPDRVVIGVDSQRSVDIMEEIYRPLIDRGAEVIFMDITSAEMTKYAANAMLAARISFMNEIALLCEKVEADVDEVRRGIGSDPRIGPKFLFAGCGCGGSCFPKDVRALIHTGEENGVKMSVIEAVGAVNDRQKRLLFEKLVKSFGSAEALKDRRIAVWGLSFKPETDDMREAPSLVLVEQLLEAGAQVVAYDPVAMNEAKKKFGDSVVLADSHYEAARGADALVLVTEWKQFREPDWMKVKGMMRGDVVVDGRNIYDYELLASLGFRYFSIGRRNSSI